MDDILPDHRTWESFTIRSYNMLNSGQRFFYNYPLSSKYHTKRDKSKQASFAVRFALRSMPSSPQEPSRQAPSQTLFRQDSGLFFVF